MMNKKSDLRFNATIFTALSVIYMEIILKLFTCNTFFDAGLLLMPLFSLIPALLLGSVCSRLKPNASKWITVSVLGALMILYSAQIIYHGFFGSYFILYSLAAGGAGQITGEGMLGSTLKAILEGIPAVLLLAVPMVLMIIFGKKRIVYRRLKWPKVVLIAATAVCIHVTCVLGISLTGELSKLQSGEFDPNLAVGKFGLLRTEVLDIKYNILGFEQNIDFDKEKPIDTSPNVMDIDFEALNAKDPKSSVKAMNEYFSSRTPTLKNEYTGMYKGYNLITITAEGFSPYAVHPELTPTLYKMSQEGFKFTNFYTPIWGVSTSDGEYAACTGLLPKSGVWSFYRSGSPIQCRSPWAICSKKSA